MTEPRVTNATILARLDGIDARLGSIEASSHALEQRIRGMESSNDQQHPLIDERISKLGRASGEHEERLRRLEEAVIKLEQTNRVLTWLVGVIGVGTIGWIVSNLLEGIR